MKPKISLADEEDGMIEVECLNCRKKARVPEDSTVGQGIFNYFCDGDCEDEYSFSL